MRARYAILFILLLWMAANGYFYYSWTGETSPTSNPPSLTTTETKSCANISAVSNSSALAFLISLYDRRPDLQATYPEVKQGSYGNLVNWAWRVVNHQVNDSAYDQLAPYSYWYALMTVYDNRPDLQTAYPNAYTSTASYHNLLCWAKGVVQQKWQDSSYSLLANYASWYIANSPC